MPVLALLLGCLCQVLAAGQPPVDILPDPADLARLAPRGAPGPAGLSGKRAPTEPAQYVVAAAANSRQVYLLPPGPRTVRELAIEPSLATAEAWRQARLRLVWESDDPEAQAGVDLPLGLLFGQVGPGVELGTTLVGGRQGPAWVCRLPMPYRAQALLEIRTTQPLDGRIHLRASKGFEPEAGYLRADSWTGAPSVTDEGRGQVVGLLVVGPARAGRLVLDGQTRGPLDEAVGLRDRDDPTAAAALVRGFVRLGDHGPTARYRWLAEAPLTYDRGLSIVDAPAAGADDGAAASARAVVFWYSDQPRSKPSPRDR